MSARWERIKQDDSGLTLIELLVSMILMGLVGTIVFTSVLATQRASESSRQVNDLNEEARLVLNRMSRELREAKAITAVVNPMGPGYSATSDTSITFEVDFNGNGTIEPSASDPEELTYYYDRANRRLLLQAAGQTYPILAANVSAFKLTYTSRLYAYDGKDGTAKDGIVGWRELDADRATTSAPCNGVVGNCNGALDLELSAIDGVTIEFSVLTGTRRQDYRTQIDLRNRPA